MQCQNTGPAEDIKTNQKLVHNWLATHEGRRRQICQLKAWRLANDSIACLGQGKSELYERVGICDSAVIKRNGRALQTSVFVGEEPASTERFAAAHGNTPASRQRWPGRPSLT